MADQPPPYEAASAQSKSDSKRPSNHFRPWTFADEVTVIRAQHVADTVSRIQTVLESRARYGISKITLVLIPAGQIDFSKSHEIIELEDRKHMLVELNEEVDSAEFWSQPQAIQDLKLRILNSLGSGSPSRPGLTRAEVRLEDYHFRSESAFGLKETATAKCIILELET